jgi:hypothetical protein
MQPKSILGNRQDCIHSSQGTKKLISSSVKTPALLFYKPGSYTAANKKSKFHQDGTKENSYGLNSYENTSLLNQN